MTIENRENWTDYIEQRQTALRDPCRPEFIDAIESGPVVVGHGVTVVPCGWSGGHPLAKIETEGISNREIHAALGIWPQEARDGAEAVTTAIELRNWLAARIDATPLVLQSGQEVT